MPRSCCKRLKRSKNGSKQMAEKLFDCVQRIQSSSGIELAPNCANHHDSSCVARVLAGFLNSSRKNELKLRSMPSSSAPSFQTLPGRRSYGHFNQDVLSEIANQICGLVRFFARALQRSSVHQMSTTKVAASQPRNSNRPSFFRRQGRSPYKE